MINLKKIETELQYNIFKNSKNYIEPNVCYITNDKLVHYNKYTIIDYSKNYLTFTPIEDSTFQFSNAGLSYSLDNGSTWTELSAATDTPTVAAGNKICFKGTITPQSVSGVGTFSSSNNFDVSGNIMSLLFGDNFIGQTSLSGKDNAFYKLFRKNTNVVNANKLVLPATTLSDSCYYQMFIGCTALITAPELPATTMTPYCYQEMFGDCTSLTSTPVLPATTLSTYCYSYMFIGCTALITAPELPATTMTPYCYQSMFRNCTSLTSAPALPATTIHMSCYGEMFRGCTSLTSAPELPATTLDKEGCYGYMFDGCSSLAYIKMLATDISGTNCIKSWLNGVAATGTFMKAEGVEIPSGASGIPEGWVVETVNV